jgi:hypothetical protein
MPWKHVSLAACLPVVHSSPGAVGHVAAVELPSQEGRAWSCRTHGSTRAHLSKEARSRAKGHVAAPELTSARRRGSGPRDTWYHRSSPRQGGEVQSWGTHGSIGAHLSKEARSEAMGHVAVLDLTSARRRGLGPWEAWWCRSPPLQGCVVRSYSLRGSVWMHALLLVLT